MDKNLERSLGLFHVTCIVMGAIIGVGIFFTPRSVVEITGSYPVALAAWTAGGLIGLMGSLTFAELGCLFPKTGGQYLILRATYGRPVGFLYCWSLLCVIHSGAIAIIALIFVEFLAEFAGFSVGDLGTRVGAALVIGGLTLANVLGLKRGASIAGATSVLKAVILLGLVAVGSLGVASHLPEATQAPRGDGSWWLVLPAMVPVMFSYGGWQQATFLAGEVKNPARNLPGGIIGGVAIVALLYVSVNLAFARLLPLEQLVASATPGSDLVGSVFPGFGRRLTALGVAVSAFGVASVCIMTAPRMYKAIADDGCFFPAIGRVHSVYHTPALAIVTQGAISLAMAATLGKDRIDYLLTGVICLDALFFFLTGLALFVLRHKLPDAERPYRAFGYPLLPGLFALAMAAIVISTFLDEKTAQASRVAVAILLSGVAAYALFRRRTAT